MVVPLASPPSYGEMRRNSPSERRALHLARPSTPVQTQGSLLPGIPSIQKYFSRRSGFYYKPLGFEDVAHLKVVWNLLIPLPWPRLPAPEGHDTKPATHCY